MLVTPEERTQVTSRPGIRGRSKIGRHLLAAGLTLSMGYAFGVFALGGCGGSQAGFAPPADGRLPERVVEKLTECGKRGPAALQPVKHAVSFDVFMAPDGVVDNVTLRDSTLHLDEVEACMENALHALSERAIDASLRRREPASPASLSPETRALFAAAPLVIGAGVLEVALVVGFMAITVFVYYQVVRNTRTHRPPPPTVVEDPPKPEPPKPAPRTEPDPKTTDPPPPPPPPPPPKEKETCEEKLPHLMRCDDPRIGWYPFSSENAAFKSIKVEGVRKKESKKEATDGPCKKRGGWHTRVKSGKDYIASIVGCYCCDDSSGKAAQKERAGVRYH